VKSFGATSEYEDELETYQSSSSEGIYTDDSSEEEVGVICLGDNPQGWNFVGSKGSRG
jgi:hypothetical protein